MSMVDCGVPTKDPPPTTNYDKTIKDFPELLHPYFQFDSTHFSPVISVAAAPSRRLDFSGDFATRSYRKSVGFHLVSDTFQFRKLSSRDRFCSFPRSLNTCDSCRLVHSSCWLCETLEVRTVAVNYLQVTFTENWNGCRRLYLIFYGLVIDSNLRQESKLENDAEMCTASQIVSFICDVKLQKAALSSHRCGPRLSVYWVKTSYVLIPTNTQVHTTAAPSLTLPCWRENKSSSASFRSTFILLESK